MYPGFVLHPQKWINTGTRHGLAISKLGWVSLTKHLGWQSPRNETTRLLMFRQGDTSAELVPSLGDILLARVTPSEIESRCPLALQLVGEMSPWKEARTADVFVC